MSLFGVALADYLAEKLNTSVEDVTDALNSFSDNFDTAPTVKPSSKKATEQKAKPPPKGDTKKATSTKSTSKTNTQKHACERIKRGQTEPCGKNASRSIGTGKNEHWFCGSDKSGCYRAELNEQAKKSLQEKNTKSNTSQKTNARKEDTKPQGKGKTNEERKAIADNKSKSLIHSLLKDIDIDKKKVNGELLYVERTKRALYDREKDEFYGILDKDGETILPLTDSVTKWLEAHGKCVRRPNVKLQEKHRTRDKVQPEKKPPVTNKSAPPVEDDEPDNEENVEDEDGEENVEDEDGEEENVEDEDGEEENDDVEDDELDAGDELSDDELSADDQ